MPAADSLTSVQEAVDGEFGETLTARSVGLSRGQVGLGPPDLCYLHKSYRSALGLGGLKLLGGTLQVAEDQSAVGFYHHVIGLDTSSPATVSAYFAELAASQQCTSWLAGGTWSISGGVYCCYDAFTRQDLRVHVTIPGGVCATLLRCDDGVVSSEVSAAAWHHASMSGLLRALCSPPVVRCLRLLPPPLTPDDEPGFLEAAQQLLRQVAPPAEAAAAAATEAGSEMCELLCVLLWRYFEQSRRFEAAIAFFAPLQAEMPACGAHVAAAQRELGELPQAIGTLCELLHLQPSSAPLLRMQVALLLQCEIKAHALTLAAHHVQLAPTALEPWLQLARAYALQGSYDLALAALNAAPLQAVAEPLEPHVGAVPLPPPARFTQTDQVGPPDGTDGGGTTAEGCSGGEQLQGQGGVSAAGGCGGSGGVGCDGGGSGASASGGASAVCGVACGDGGTASGAAATELPAESLAGGELQAYGVLVDLVNELGWGQLLEHRSAAFVMRDDAGAPAATPTADECSAARPTSAEAALPAAASQAAGEQFGRKRQCHVWLDGLFRALYCDLQVFADWHCEEEEELTAARRVAAEGGDRGGPSGDMGGWGRGEARRVGAGGATAFEWMQRARLAVRLKQPAYGAAAWASAVRELEEVLDGELKLESAMREVLEAQWTQACAAVMQLHAAGDAGAIPEALGAAKRLLDACGVEEAVAPREIAAAVYQMVAKHGLQAVRAAQRSLGEAHNAINHIFHDVVQWKVHGFSQ